MKINVTLFKTISFHITVLKIVCLKLTRTFALMWNCITFPLVNIMQATTGEMAYPFFRTAAAPEVNIDQFKNTKKHTFNEMSEHIPVQLRLFFIHKIFITISIRLKKYLSVE